MKHARDDYNRIQDPQGLIPQDEPVFLLRGQDTLAPMMVRAWANAMEILTEDKEMIKAANDQADAMEAWQVSVRQKVADMPKEDPRILQLIDDLRQKLFHHSDEEAKPVIDDFLNHNLILLTVHNRDWYYKNC